MIRNIFVVFVITVIAEALGILRLGIGIAAGIIIADGIKQQVAYLRGNGLNSINPLWEFGVTLLASLPAILLGCVIGNNLLTIF